MIDVLVRSIAFHDRTHCFILISASFRLHNSARWRCGDLLMRSAILLSFCFLACGLLPAQQAPNAPQTFAVATIKTSAPDAVVVTQIRGNRFATEGTTFVDVFQYAYNVHPDHVV